MKKRLLIFLTIILWIAAVGAYAAADSIGWSRQEAGAAYTDGCQSGKQIYLIENTPDGGILYVTDGEGQVEHLFLTSNRWENSALVKLDENNGGVYGVVSEPDQDPNGVGILYRVVRFDNTGLPAAQTPPLKLAHTGKLTGFQVGETGFYLTVVLDGGESAGVCFADASLMAETGLEGLPAGGEESGEENVEEAVEIGSLETSYSADGRLITAADYENGVFTFCTDDGSGMEAFTDPEPVRAAFANRELTAKQWIKLRFDRLMFYLQILAGGIVGLIILWVLLRNRTHTVYAIVVVELVLLAVSGLGVWQVAQTRNRVREEESRRFAYYYLETLAEDVDAVTLAALDGPGFYDSEAYRSLQEKLSGFTGMDGVSGLFSDICLVDSDSHRILVSASRNNGMKLEDLYAGGTQEMIADLSTGTQKEHMTVNVGGNACQILGIPVSGGVRSDQLLIAVTGASAETGTPWRYFAYALIIFAAGSVVCIALLRRQNRELARFVEAIQTVAGGGAVEAGGLKAGKDIRLMWNSLQEISKTVSRTNYSRYQVLKSSYRFIPKKMEKILGKDSIMEVNGGDFVRLYGTVAVLSSQEPAAQARRSAEMINRYVTLIEKYQKENEGFFVAAQCDLSVMKLLFLDHTNNTINFGVSFLQEFYGDTSLSSMQTGVLLHYSLFTYGVAGTNTQSFSFLLSAQMRELERYADWFEYLGLKLVITETVKEREKPESFLRYIGYIRLTSNGEQLKLYEVLDACPHQELRVKAETNDRFQEAIRLFYQEDFYLARNAFSDILKDNPVDYIAKWYLFTCEKYLNEAHPAGDICRLAPDEGMKIR